MVVAQPPASRLMRAETVVSICHLHVTASEQLMRHAGGYESERPDTGSRVVATPLAAQE